MNLSEFEIIFKFDLINNNNNNIVEIEHFQRLKCRVCQYLNRLMHQLQQETQFPWREI